MSWLNHTAPASGAPHSLQKFASATTTGLPHCEQKRGGSIFLSGIEGKDGVTKLQHIAIIERRLRDAFATEPRAILTAEVAHHEITVARFDARMMARN